MEMVIALLDVQLVIMIVEYKFIIETNKNFLNISYS